MHIFETKPSFRRTSNGGGQCSGYEWRKDHAQWKMYISQSNPPSLTLFERTQCTVSKLQKAPEEDSNHCGNQATIGGTCKEQYTLEDAENKDVGDQNVTRDCCVGTYTIQTGKYVAYAWLIVGM